ncbi:hypothetical protein MRB53_026860 [Persea americana]|uniref:Uncharacterized protein n=1 Tax=Persea americana TaxID=3435 RepID=A0ACC2LKE6_PERAE|nr:hypothetical protein MRB53_026860 [Persea americana]
MEIQAEAERRKHAQVLESEGERQANINIADGKKVSVILESEEAAMMDQVNRAKERGPERTWAEHGPKHTCAEHEGVDSVADYKQKEGSAWSGPRMT